MKILFAGDTFLGGDLYNCSTSSIVDSETYANSDIRIINLEQPVSCTSLFAAKATLYTGSFAVEQLRQLGIHAVNLANNHIHDKTPAGIRETIEHLEKGKIGHFGAGRTRDEARKPYWINEEICILGYCDFGKPYLNQICIAEVDSPGVNPLTYENIRNDVDMLPPGVTAIIFLHWGREHTWLPPSYDIELARKILNVESVGAVIGMHAHRIQGYLVKQQKHAYISLGNFLFPNFFLVPPIQIFYPECHPEHYSVTRLYHNVHRLTYKKWKMVNRISLMVQLDTTSGVMTHTPVMQDDDRPTVREVHGTARWLVLLWVRFLSTVYRLPLQLYQPLEFVVTKITRSIYIIRILMFYLRQNGAIWFFKKLSIRIRRALCK